MSNIIEVAAVNVHTHLRDFDEAHKETIESGTRAAIAGGWTTVLDMPNNRPPITDHERLRDKLTHAERSTRCYYGAYLVGVVGNAEDAAAAADMACGLKIYLDNTHGALFVRDLAALREHFRLWPRGKPIVVHAEDTSLPMALGLAAVYRQHLHVAHVTQASEIALIREAKGRGFRITCEVTPHHLFLTEADAARLGPYGYMKPELKPASDVEALWANIDVIDCIADDHAPHTVAEKESGSPPPGVPGLETTLPLMFNAVREGRLSLQRLLDMVSTNPRQIFNLPDPAETYAVFDLDAHYHLNPAELHTKVGWSPFEGHNLTGRVRRVVVRGQTVFRDGQFLDAPLARLVI